MRQNDTQRQPVGQPQRQQPRQPQQQPPQNRTQQPQQQPRGQQPPVRQQPPMQAPQSHPPQSALGQPQPGSQQPPQRPLQRRQQATQTVGMPPAMASQQGQPQQMRAPAGRPPAQMGRGQTHLHPVSIDDIIQRDVVTASPETPIRTISAQMNEADVGSVVIVEDNKPVSLLTDRKIALAIEGMPDITERTAEDLISGDLTTGTDDMSVYEALQQLSGANIRRLPITDNEGTLVGIVTLDDVIVLLANEIQDCAEIIRAQSPRL